MTILEQIRAKGRQLRVIYFVVAALMAVVLFLYPEPPYIYAFYLGVAMLVTVFAIAYRTILCPRCKGSAWIAGMGFVVPGATTGPGCNCPKCGVNYGELAGP